MSKRKSIDLLPVIFRTDANNRFLTGTVDQLIQQPKLKKIDGFIGDKAAVNYNPETDYYVNAESKKSLRTDYELEPGIVIRNAITDKVEFSKTYEDMLNSLKFYGSDISNQNRLFKQQSYAWNPHIDLDKFVNYRNYAWLPEGPPTILVSGDEKETSTTITVGIVDDINGESWKFSNDSVSINPTITLYRGMTYIFDVDTVDNPFYIKTKRTSGSLDALTTVTNNGASKGQVIFEVTSNTPATLFYVSGKDNSTFGKFLVRNKDENTNLNVETDILGKKEYSITGKFALSNGMKIKFSNSVVPESYREKTFIVEGVGKSIVLVDFETLVTIESYATEVETSFDQTAFDALPFDEVSEYPVDPDYILINRASQDKNPWSRYNRWFHVDVITLSSEINNIEPSFGVRATRPIIEFEPNLQLFNFATVSKRYVDFLDKKVTDAYSQVEGSVGYFIDGVQLQNGNRVIFTEEKDLSIKNKVFEVQFLDIEGTKKLHLELVADSTPEENQGLLVLSGDLYGGTTWVFKNNDWVISQRKTSLNQPPLFDLFDVNGLSFSDTFYKNNNFAGTKIFGYQVGTGTNDPVLGFPLKYNNISNVGGYLFENFLLTGTSSYINPQGTVSYNEFKNGFLKLTDSSYVNGWIKTNAQSIQEIIDQKIAIGGETFFEFKSLDIRTPKTSLRVFKNGKLLPDTAYTISTDSTFNAYYLHFSSALVKNDVIVIKVLPDYDKGEDGKYETPINLVNNPLNESPSSVSYAEINDHINSIVVNASKSLGITVDRNNLRDLTDLAPYGRRFVQHEGLVSIAGAMLSDKNINVVSAIRWAALEYQRYKTLLLQKFSEIDGYTSISEALDKLITEIGKDKTANSPFYFSDMVPYGLNKRDYEYVVREANIKSYAYGSKLFSPLELNNNAVLVYLNGSLLLRDVDYVFDTVEPLVTILRNLTVGDKIVLKYYNNIYGNCMPYSPTKLGLYPAFVPSIYSDSTYIEPTDVIQGHDGSITVCYGDDRDALLLELETRIYNNLTIFYDNKVFDITDVLPGIFRSDKEDLVRVNRSIEEEFLRWTGLYNIDYETNENEIYGGNFSYNFIDAVGDLNPETVLNGSWRKIYRYYFDTDRPHSHPWEMLGFSIKPTWWEDEYGPAPYTAGNDVLWKDLELGYIRQGDRQGYDEQYKRPGLSNIIPVDSYGELKDPFDVNVVRYFDFSKRYDKWKFGDMGPAESSWRRSHLYPFALQIAMALNSPAKYLTLCFDTSRNVFNNAGQLVYKETNQRIAPKDLKVFSDNTDSFVFATGYSPYLVENLRVRYVNPAQVLKDYINNIKSNLIYKMGGFASKDKFKVALETVTSYKTVDNVFVPEENYQLFLSSGNPIKTLSMSGIIVERSDRGFVIKGYDSVSPYFKIKKAIHSPSDPIVSVGGVTESFIYWSANSNITGGSVVAVGQKFYRAVSTHVTKESFEPSMYYPLPYLPTIGGVEATVAQTFEEAITTIPYGTVCSSIQDVFDIILGYGQYLESEGFIFDKVLDNLEVIADWKLAGKEFLFWSVQNWATNSVISLAPFADTIQFYSNDSVVDDLNDVFYNFVMLKSDGSSVDKNRINIVREEGKVTIDTAQIPNDGIYFIKLNLVQKEHVVVFDNFTIFNDLVYQPYSGYRQSRFKVAGYITDGWTGDYYVPGFIYDSAKIDDWQPNVDYSIGDVVRYQTKYYQARTKLLPVDNFNYEDWSDLGKTPVAQLLPNYEYMVSQFEEFYDVDGETFDNTQRKFAQKLTGYTPRNYLNALIVDEKSQYKFYQGFIKEKGTVSPLEKFSVASNESTGSHLGLQEEWAVRLGAFGGENTYKEIEFSLNQDKFNQNPQLFEFVYGNNVTTTSKSYEIDRASLTVVPVDYDGKPWPTLDTSAEGGSVGYSAHQKLPTAGYVRIDDVTFTALYENNILELGTSGALQEGDTVWIAMDPKGEWKVKRYTKSNARVINYQVDNTNNLIEFITDVAHNFKLRDFVSISRLQDPLNGVYEVIGVNTPTSFVVSTTFNDIAEPEGELDGSLFYFLTVRFSTPDELASIPGIARWKNCEFVWIDDIGTGNWAVLEKEPTAIATPLRPFKDASNQHFGQAVEIAPHSNIIVVSATNVEKGRIYIYRREVLGLNEVQLDQSYLVEENVSDLLSVQTIKNGIDVPEMPRNHGSTISIWENTNLTLRYIATGAPNASGAKWVNSNTNFANQSYRKPVEFSFNTSGVFDEGLVKIVKYDDADDQFVTDIVLAGPIVQAESNFGHKVKLVGTDKPFMLVSSPGQDQSTGSVFVYYLDSNNEWQIFLVNNIPFDFRSKLSQINPGSEFGWDIAASDDGKTVVISAPYYLKDNVQAHTGAAFIFEKNAVDYSYVLKQTVYADDYIEPADLLLKGVTNTYTTVEQTLVFNSENSTLTRNRGNFIQDGFRTGQTVKITGSRFNNFEFLITGISASTLTFKSNEQMSNENVTSQITVVGLGSARKDRFGDTLTITADGSTVMISSDHASHTKLDAGMVYVLTKEVSGQYTLHQKISSPSLEAGEMFGSNIQVSPDGNLLMVSAAGGDQATSMYFDSYVERYTNSLELYGSEYVLNPKSSIRPVRTTFDGGSTRFVNRAVDSGVVYLYQKLGNYYVFGESLVSGDAASADGYGTGIATNGAFCLVGAPKYEYKVEGQLEDNPGVNTIITYTDAGSVIFFDNTPKDCGCGSAWSWSLVRSQDQGLVDVEKIKKVITYDTRSLEILENYDIYDPVKGKIPNKVIQEIKYITPYDPAVYTVAVEVNNKNRVDNKTTWTADHVGELWLDTSTLRYVWYEQGSAEYRINNWGKLFPGATVDVYEWVKSDYRPSEWAELADTEDGLAQGISGQPKNPDNTVVSINQYYDPVINDFVNVYYFWVRNKITLPDLSFRSISSFECARIIEDPKTQGIKYAAFLSPGSLALANTQKDLDATKISVDIYYQTSDNEVSRHSHWQLVNENNKYFTLDPVIERKMIDSLVGQDVSGNQVPDPTLSPKMRYGTLSNPRQSWFVHREAALKTLTKFVNGVLEKFDTVGKVNLDGISGYDQEPLISYGYYDEVVDTETDLLPIGTVGKKLGKLQAEVINGRLVNVVILDPGLGYKIAPTVEILGDGVGAKVQTSIDLTGSIVSVKIISQGTGYTEAPQLLVRPYAVLVTIDNQIGKWAIYHSNNNVFERKFSQTYDTRKYWDYVDWVAIDYNVAIPPKFVLSFVSDLETVNYSIGDTVKILNTGDSRSIILRKTATGYGNYLSDYDLIYREKGTIKFSEKMYDRSVSGLGFDTFVGYDQNGFDESNALELRIILNSLKEDIFVGELAEYWNKFIFTAIRYVLSEQLFVDWVYKTSFITPVINAGTLNQKSIYRFNDFSYVEEFIKEIKPYKSKFRAITTNYDANENMDIGVTDFDLPAYVDVNGRVVLPTQSVIENVYPFKHWNNNRGFSIKAINIANPGSGYRIPPEVVITPATGDAGTGATAIARISNGKLSEIIVTNSGSGYLMTPVVSIIGGGNYESDFVQGTASALLTNPNIRTSEITLKFDRTSEKGLFTGQYYSRNFTTDGTTLNYVLAYPVNDLDDNYPALQDKDTIKVFVNEVEMSEDTYRLTFRADLSTIITFNVALPANQNLRIQYIKNILYTKDIFEQTSSNYRDDFKLTFPPELDNQKIIISVINNITKVGSIVPSSDYLIQLRQESVGGKYVGYIAFKNVPNINSTITVQYAKSINIQNAVDRIITSYEPTAGMPGKDISQLLKGVEFGGVQIQGLNFTVSSGWDGLPWFTQGWDTFVNEYKDFLVISDGATFTYDLGYVPLLGTQINVYFDGVRVDDENYNTINQRNKDALFKTLIANGASSTITLPIIPPAGGKIEIRQSMSDGVNMPSDDFVMDTSLSGGDFTTIKDALETRFRTATGLRPDDISVDGGQFLSVEHSPSTEELVKGEVFDTLTMTVFNSPSSGSNLVKTTQYLFDGTNTTREIEGYIDSSQSIDVYINNFATNRETDFTVTPLENGNSLITLTTNQYGMDTATATDKISVTIQNMSIGGKNILSRQNYIVTASDFNSSTIELESTVNIDDVGSFYVSVANTSVLVKKSAKSKRAKLVITNTPKLPVGSLVTFILFSSTVRTYSEVYNQEISIDANSTYTLARPPGNIEPLHVMAAVTRLTPTNMNWKGDWTNNVQYNLGDTVLFVNKSYECILAHTSLYSLTSVSFSSWVAATNYVVGDIVNYGQATYICIADHTSNNSSNVPTNNMLWALHTGNRPDEDYANIYWREMPTQRMLPPETEYYEVTEDAQTFNLGTNFPYLSRSLSVSDIEVYRNGKIMASNRDYEFDNVSNTVKLSSGVSFVGDVIAISVLRGADYYIRNGAITFTSSAKLEIGQKIVVTTYTNHDENLMRREVFKGKRFQNEYKISRRILSINTVWVDMNGRPLIPNVDYDIRDNFYVKISEKYVIGENDRIVVTSINEVTSVDPIAYRMFKDMTNMFQFKRLSKKATTILTQELLPTDREIFVEDGSIFGFVDARSPNPGVIFIGGERIEFKSVNGNSLGNITRGTKGTGVADTYPIGSKVFNSAQSETVPYKEGNIIRTFATPANYRYNEEVDAFQKLVNGVWTDDVADLGLYELTDFRFNDSLSYEDQVTVYMGGRVLMKPTKEGNPIIRHDFSITLDSDSTNSLGQSGSIEVDPDFTITKLNGSYFLQINRNSLMRDETATIIPDLQIKVVQKVGKIWYTLNGDQTIQQDSTVQAKFLQEFPAELPDKNYYGISES